MNICRLCLIIVETVNGFLDFGNYILVAMLSLVEVVSSLTLITQKQRDVGSVDRPVDYNPNPRNGVSRD